MTGEWTGVDELDDVLAELVSNAQMVLGPDLVGVYLQGSFALGGADGESDCDFLVITTAPLDDGRLTALRVFHRDLPHRPGYWNAHLQGSYAPAADVADLGAIGRPWPYVDHGSDEVILHPHCNTEVTRWTLWQRGMTLSGPTAPLTSSATSVASPAILPRDGRRGRPRRERMTRVVRVGSTVRRPVRPFTATVQAYLRHLHSRGFRDAPEAFGYDDQGREVLSYVAGDVPVQPLPDRATGVDALVALGRLIRRLHDAAEGWVPPGDAVWGRIPGRPSAGVAPLFDQPELVSHMDYCPGNVVFRDGLPAHRLRPGQAHDPRGGPGQCHDLVGAHRPPDGPAAGAC